MIVPGRGDVFTCALPGKPRKESVLSQEKTAVPSTSWDAAIPGDLQTTQEGSEEQMEREKAGCF